MLDKAKSWHGGLSKVRKVVFWAVIAVVSMATVGAANPSPPAETPKQPEAAVQQKVEPVVETKSELKTEEVAFTSTTVNDANLDQGKTQIKTAGVNGVKTITYEVKYQDGKELSRKLIKEEVTTSPVVQITANGTKQPYVAPAVSSNCDPNYTPCVPNVSYDLDCPDIGYSVTVIGSDPHRFDANNDGHGCESY